MNLKRLNEKCNNTMTKIYYDEEKKIEKNLRNNYLIAFIFKKNKRAVKIK